MLSSLLAFFGLFLVFFFVKAILSCPHLGDYSRKARMGIMKTLIEIVCSVQKKGPFILLIKAEKNYLVGRVGGKGSKTSDDTEKGKRKRMNRGGRGG